MEDAGRVWLQHRHFYTLGKFRTFPGGGRMGVFGERHLESFFLAKWKPHVWLRRSRPLHGEFPLRPAHGGGLWICLLPLCPFSNGSSVLIFLKVIERNNSALARWPNIGKGDQTSPWPRRKPARSKEMWTFGSSGKRQYSDWNQTELQGREIMISMTSGPENPLLPD